MNLVELVDELTDICVRQAEIIKSQAFVIEQLGAQAQEDSTLTDRLYRLIEKGENHG